MQIPKWAWCFIGGFVAVVPMMGATILDSEQVQCVEQDGAGEVRTALGSDCDRPAP